MRRRRASRKCAFATGVLMGHEDARLDAALAAAIDAYADLSRVKRFVSELHSGITWGTTPKTTSCSSRAPVARIPSTGRGSIDFDRFGKELREHTEIVNENRHDAGEGTETDRNDEHQREHDLVDGAAGVHQPPGRLHDPLRADIARAQDRERDAEQDGQRRAPDGDLDRHDHVG